MTPGEGVGRRSELELFEALRSREDPADLAEFADRLRRCVHWVLNRMDGGRRLSGEIEDIVGDARLRLEQLRERGFGGGAPEFKSYLYKVVVSACVEAAKRQRWTVALDAPVTLPDGDEKPLGDVVSEMVDQHLAIDADLEAHEERATVLRALDRLDGRCRSLLTSFHLQEVPIKELARREGTRTNTIEVALTRCRTRLYEAFLVAWVDGSDDERRERITKAGARLPGRLGDVFRGWWMENRSVVDISEEQGLPTAETRKLLGRAKVEVWRMLSEGVTP